MSLRLQINLIIAAMLLAFAALLVGLQLKDTSRGVQEEIGGSNLVAIQVLSQVEVTSREGGLGFSFPRLDLGMRGLRQ